MPDRKAVTLSNVTEEKLLSDVRLDNFRDYHQLLKVISRLLRCAKFRSFKEIFVDPSTEELIIRAAEQMWIRAVQSDMS